MFYKWVSSVFLFIGGGGGGGVGRDGLALPSWLKRLIWLCLCPAPSIESGELFVKLPWPFSSDVTAADKTVSLALPADADRWWFGAAGGGLLGRSGGGPEGLSPCEIVEALWGRLPGLSATGGLSGDDLVFVALVFSSFDSGWAPRGHVWNWPALDFWKLAVTAIEYGLSGGGGGAGFNLLVCLRWALGDDTSLQSEKNHIPF